MRRLITSVAVTAAALLGPSAALGAPVITSPAAPLDTFPESIRYSGVRENAPGLA